MSAAALVGRPSFRYSRGGAAPAADIMSSHELSLVVGSILQGRYEIVAEVGRGSFASVYRARQLSTGQQVAVKILRATEDPQAADAPNSRERFRREMRLSADLSHPNIVRLIDSGEGPDGLLYAVFEFVPGSTLKDVLAEEGKLPARDAIRLMTQVLDALACAHGCGVVHRDLKPANIMITKTGALRNAMVLDFGLGGILREVEDRSLPRLTATHELLGTPCYAAPEQLRGEEPSVRSDLYSWGLVLLECLTGELPVQGHSGQDVIMRQLGPDPIPIPTWLQSHRLGRMLAVVTAKQVEKRDVTIEGLLDVLGATAGTEIMAEPDRPLPREVTEGERRQLTVVSCGLTVDPADDSRGLGLEELDELLHALEAVVREAAGSAGGHVSSALGERLLMVFGHPQAREDDARRAVRAAFGIVAAVERARARLENEERVQVSVRLGVHTGVVIVRELRGRGDRTLTETLGRTPQMAIRLETSAGPGEVLASADTYRLVRGIVQGERLGTLRLSEHSAGTAYFRLRARPSAMQSPGIVDATPLIGRRLEHAQLLDSWSETCGGRSRATLVTGEPGIGKSRLLRELRREVPLEAWLHGRCVPEHQSSPLRPVAELIATFPQPVEELLQRLGFDLAQTVPLIDRLLERPPDERYPPLALSREREKELMLATLVSLVIRMAQEHPLALAIEDLQWADPTTIELAGLLVEEMRGARLMTDETPTRLCLIFTARPEFVAPWSVEDVTLIQPSPLDREEIAAMISAVLTPDQRAPAHVLDLVARRSDGIPLFVEEVTRVIAEAGQLTPPIERVDPDAPGFDIPTSLRDLLAARLDPLSSSVRETAQIAAALGREFRYELLRSVISKDESRLREDLQELLQVGLVYARRAARVESYVFKHALVRDAAYESMTRPTRRRVHCLIAETLRERFPEIAQAQPEVLAQHYEKGEQPEAAAEHWHRAASRSVRLGAYVEATRQLERGLAILQAQPLSQPRLRKEIELLVTQGVFLAQTRGSAVDEVEATLARADSLSRRLGEDLPLQVVNGLMSMHVTRSDRKAVEQLLPQFQRMAEQQDDVLAHTSGHLLLGIEAFWRGDFASARLHVARTYAFTDSEEMRRYVRDYGHESTLYAHAYLMLSLWHLGYPDQAREILREMVARGEAASDPYSILIALGFGVALPLHRGETEAALAMIDRLTTIATEQKLFFWLAGAMCARGMALVHSGAAAAGVGLLRQGMDVYRGIGVMASYSYYLSEIVAGHLAAGQLDEGLALADEGLDLCDRLLARFHRPELLRLRGEILLARGDVEAGEGSMRRAVEAARAQQGRAYELRAAMSLARLLDGTGRRSEGHDLLAGVYRWFAEGLETRDLFQARALLEVLGEGRLSAHDDVKDA
jgi:TOMM system kinase/cyclase fusion protein